MREKRIIRKRAFLIGLLLMGLLAVGVGVASLGEYGTPTYVKNPGAATTLVLLDERGQAVWTLAMGERPSPEALEKAVRLVGYDPQGVKVFERPVVRVNGELMVDLGWGLVRLDELVTRTQENVRRFAARVPAPYYHDDDYYEYRYKYGSYDDSYEYRYKYGYYGDDAYEYGYRYYDDDYYEYRYKYGYPYEGYEYRYPYDD